MSRSAPSRLPLKAISTRWRRSTSRSPLGRRRKSRSLRMAASRAATLPCPSSRPLSTRCASRGCCPSRAIARPCGVIAPGRIERAEIEQQGARRGQRGGGRRRQPGQGGVARAPQRQFERQRRQVGVEDLGRREGQQAALRLLGPQAIADAGFEAAGAAAALVGRGLAHPHRLQPRHARARREARHPHQPAIDHDAHALDGEAGLGDRGRQHDLAPAGGRGRDGAVLVGRRQVAVERRHVDIGAEVAQALLDPADLADAGQEDQRAAAFVGERSPHRSTPRRPRCGRRARGRDSASRPGTCDRPLRSPARRPAFATPARDRGSPTWRSRAGPRAAPSAPRAPGRRKGRSPARARAARRRSRSRRRRATGSSCSIRRNRPSVTTSMRVRGPTLLSSRTR